MTMKRALPPLLALTLIGGSVAVAPDALAAPVATSVTIAPTDGDGITVDRVEDVTDRTKEIFISSAKVSPKTTHPGELSLRVTFPADYDSSGKQYPVLYLLHGQDGSVQNWTDAGDAEEITAGQDVIVVSVEGGKAGWYTDWARQWQYKQSWETFHTQQVIPFVDRNFRTKASKQHRGIAGLSMGGYGAMHYATKRPDLFSHVSSYSGGVILKDPGTHIAVNGSAFLQGMIIDSPFGAFWDKRWNTEDPYQNAEKLRGMSVSLYTGDGKGGPLNFGNILEQNTNRMAAKFHNKLDSLGIPHTYQAYGHDVSNKGYTCDGGHNFGCWNMSLAMDMPQIMKAIG